MIEPLLLYPPMPTPYLGPAPAAAQGPNSAFQALLQPAAPQPVAPQPLQSAAQQLNISFQAQQSRSLTQPANPQMIQQLSQQLSQTTQQQLLRHPVQSLPTLSEYDLLLLLALQGQKRVRKQDQPVPSNFAMLSFLPVERPYLRSLPRRKKLQIAGIPFMHFQFFDWENETATDSEGQPQGREQTSEEAPADDSLAS